MNDSMPVDPPSGSMFDVEICHALPERQTLLTVTVAAGTTVREAIEQSRIIERCPEIDLSTQAVGIFGKIQALDTPVSAGDRVEIYRPLTVDPKLARQRRVSKARAGSVEGRRWLAKERRPGS